ncbi:MAG: M20/M25/M40 family metallo-hydrolase, partial [Acidimicrobiia bacterium]|nr:M20/M25/M40 family metallo-hydrolase [Acidimicrobiia bacterium]
EEAGGGWGARWMAEHHWDAIACDYLLTEMGGWPSGDGRRVGVSIGEKGLAWRRLRVGGTPGHGSMPFRSDNAVVKAAEIVRRLADYRPQARLDELWAARVEASGLPSEVRAGLVDPARLEDALAGLPAAQARHLHACTHTTISPNVLHGGVKTNVIPDTVEIDVDVRTLPGVTGEDVNRYLGEALGELAEHVTVEELFNDESTASSVRTPLWDALGRGIRAAYPQADLLAELIVGATDSRFFRERGTVAYGAGAYSPGVTFADFASRFHGNDERVDVASLELCTDLWLAVARDLLD